QEPRTHETVIDQIVERVASIHFADKEPVPDVVKTFRFVDDRCLQPRVYHMLELHPVCPVDPNDGRLSLVRRLRHHELEYVVPQKDYEDEIAIFDTEVALHFFQRLQQKANHSHVELVNAVSCPAFVDIVE